MTASVTPSGSVPSRERKIAPRRSTSSVLVGSMLWSAIFAALTKHEAWPSKSTIGRMDAVIHNAGIYIERSRGSTPEGHATILAVNTLAPYILTALIERPDRLIFVSSGLHRGGAGSLNDIDWTMRPRDSGKAYAESKLQVVALAFALAMRWPDVLSNAVDPGWVRTRMGGAGAPVDLDTGQRTQSWLAVSEESAAKVSGSYWHHGRQETPAAEAADVAFQHRLIERLAGLTGVALPSKGLRG